MGVEERRKVDTSYLFFFLIKKGRLSDLVKLLFYLDMIIVTQKTAQKRLRQTCSIKSHALRNFTKTLIKLNTATTHLTIKLQQD